MSAQLWYTYVTAVLDDILEDSMDDNEIYFYQVKRGIVWTCKVVAEAPFIIQ